MAGETWCAVRLAGVMHDQKMGWKSAHLGCVVGEEAGEERPQETRVCSSFLRWKC